MNFLYVFLGGGAGSLCRYAIALFLKKQAFAFPAATLLANVLACLILGFLFAFAANGKLSETQKLLLMTGFCGGFSTFSTFSAETFALIQDGNMMFALLNILLSVAICLIGIYIGYYLAQQFLG